MSFDACAELVQKGDPDRFRCAMVAPVALRGRLMAIYAFNLEVAKAPWVTQEPMIAQIRLQFWHDEIEAVFAGKTGSKHEVLGPLAQVISEANLPREPFDALINARMFEIRQEPHANRAEFDMYIHNTSGTVMEMAARALGAGDPAIPSVRDYAYAFGVAKLLQALPVLYAGGRDPIPTGWVPDFDAISKGNAPEPLVRAVTEIARDALTRLDVARRGRRLVPRSALAAVLPGRDAETILRNVLKSPNNVLRLAPLSEFQQRASLLWRASFGLW
jgi:15-cis-phytoene synthase